MTPTAQQPGSDIERPRSCPAAGAIPAFDAGWNAHKVGLDRETVSVFSPDEDARQWALMAYDARAQLEQAA